MSQKGTQYGAGEQAYAYETASSRDIKTRQSFACMHAAVMRVRARAAITRSCKGNRGSAGWLLPLQLSRLRITRVFSERIVYFFSAVPVTSIAGRTNGTRGYEKEEITFQAN